MAKRILTIAMALAIIAAMALPMAVSAAEPSTVITGSILSSYTFTAPGAIDLGDMTGTVTGSGSGGKLTGNNPLGYTVTAIDAKVTNKGFMVSGTTPLSFKFKIGATAGTVADADDEDITLLHTTTPGTDTPVPFYVSQEVGANETPGDYQITITFTIATNAT